MIARGDSLSSLIANEMVIVIRDIRHFVSGCAVPHCP